MGLLAYFEKTSEGEATVEYRVGESPENMPHVIRLDKVTRRVIPANDGDATPYLLSVAQVIARRRRVDGIWPGRGVKAG